MDELKNSSASPQLGIPPIASHHERLLHEVESTDGQLGAILRSLYDGDEQDAFVGSLSSRIKIHDRDIERMCNKNYQGFIESVSELLKVKSDALKLKRKVQEANSIIQDTGQELMKSAEDLHHARQVQQNIFATVETLSLCVPVLQLYCKLSEEMDARQYYSALKTLEQLEHTFLPRVRGYTFSDLLSREIPRLRKSIEDQSKAELTDFLTNVRDKSEYIGEVAMHQAQRHSNLELDQDVVKLLDPEKKPDPEGCAQDLIDFSPVYRCLHIHSVLGKRDQFMDDYRNQRRRQVRLAIKPHGQLSGEIADYKRYFYGIVGFFVVEDTILHTSQSLVPHGKGGEDEGLVTGKTVHEFWQMALLEVMAVLRNNCNSTSDYHLLLKIKQLVVWFCHTIRGYGFEVDKLYEVLLEIRDWYDDLLMKTWADNFTQTFDSDNYSPVQVFTDEQYHGVLEVFPYQDLELAAAPYPKAFPFSGMVQQVYQQLQLFIVSCTGYADKLNLSQTEIDYFVRKSLNLLFNRVMSNSLSKLIHKEGLTIPQLVQIWINIHHLEAACEHLDKYIATVTKADKEAESAVKLNGAATFKDACQATEQQISHKLGAKVAEIMEGAEYDWMPKEPIREPSDYLEDCLQFMDATFATLQLLPEELATTICVEAVNFLAGCVQSALLSDKSPKISMIGIRSFSVDIKRCRNFLRSHSSGMAAIHESEGHRTFEVLSQLVNMFMDEDWTTYITDYTTSIGKYKDVPAPMVQTVLFKVKAAEHKKKKKFHPQSSAKKERKKYYDLILKKLETLPEPKP